MQVPGLAVAQRQQVQVVVAQHRGCRIPQVPDETQAGQRLRAAVDQVAGKPEPVPARVEPDFLQQLSQLIEASLEIANGVGGHGFMGSFMGSGRTLHTQGSVHVMLLLITVCAMCDLTP